MHGVDVLTGFVPASSDMSSSTTAALARSVLGHTSAVLTALHLTASRPHSCCAGSLASMVQARPRSAGLDHPARACWRPSVASLRFLAISDHLILSMIYQAPSQAHSGARLVSVCYSAWPYDLLRLLPVAWPCSLLDFCTHSGWWLAQPGRASGCRGAAPALQPCPSRWAPRRSSELPARWHWPARLAKAGHHSVVQPATLGCSQGSVLQGGQAQPPPGDP